MFSLAAIPTPFMLSRTRAYKTAGSILGEAFPIPSSGPQMGMPFFLRWCLRHRLHHLKATCAFYCFIGVQIYADLINRLKLRLIPANIPVFSEALVKSNVIPPIDFSESRPACISWNISSPWSGESDFMMAIFLRATHSSPILRYP